MSKISTAHMPLGNDPKYVSRGKWYMIHLTCNTIYSSMPSAVSILGGGVLLEKYFTKEERRSTLWLVVVVFFITMVSLLYHTLKHFIFIFSKKQNKKKRRYRVFYILHICPEGFRDIYTIYNTALNIPLYPPQA